MQLLDDTQVAIADTGRADYSADADQTVWRALTRAAGVLKWSDTNRGPFAQVVPPGARVLIKPNLVTHANQAPYGIEPLLTHRSLINAAFEGARAAGAAEIVIGDAPIQSCDFAAMLCANGLDEWSRKTSSVFPAFTGIRDFRRTVCNMERGVRHAFEDRVSLDQFTLFDLGTSSLLDPVTDSQGRFRVTCYDPRLMRRTHAPGRHQYLVAKDVLRADVVINLPKLKMHKKAGITGALKNLVGINGNKEFLPHHRVGGSSNGGDCYPGFSRAKSVLEYVLDRQNSASSEAHVRLWNHARLTISAILKLRGDRLGIEGSWSGNDTVWRMALDLNRIVLYGRTDGTLADQPQRKLVNLVDAVVAGQGNGPLAPEPFPLGLLILGQNPAAVDWVGALLLGYEPMRIPLARNAFSVGQWELARFHSADVEIDGDLGRGSAGEVLPSRGRAVPTRYPAGWIDAARYHGPHQVPVHAGGKEAA